KEVLAAQDDAKAPEGLPYLYRQRLGQLRHWADRSFVRGPEVQSLDDDLPNAHLRQRLRQRRKTTVTDCFNQLFQLKPCLSSAAAHDWNTRARLAAAALSKHCTAAAGPDNKE